MSPASVAAVRGARLRAIDLHSLNELAALQTRVDRKYIIDIDTFNELLEAHTDVLFALEIDGKRAFKYETQYFDTPDFDLYRAAALSRRNRFKVRTRVYQGAEIAMLEVKVKDGRGKTVKSRTEYPLADRHRITPSAAAFVEQATGKRGAADGLQPNLLTQFNRMTVVDEKAEARATFDRGLVSTDSHGRSASLDAVIVESKSNGLPAPIDRWLWRLGTRPTGISKYSTAIAALNPELPSNKWHRTLQRHFR